MKPTRETVSDRIRVLHQIEAVAARLLLDRKAECDYPTGKSPLVCLLCHSSVQPFSQKYSAFPKLQISAYLWPSRPDRGACPDRQRCGAGCDGRGSVGRARWLQGGINSVSDRMARRRTALLRTVKSCGPDASTPASSQRKASWPDRAMSHLSAGDGGKKARSPGRTRIIRQAIAQGRPECLR